MPKRAGTAIDIELVAGLADRRDRCGGEPLRFLAVGRMTLDLRENRQTLTDRERALGEHKRRGAVGIRRGRRRRDRAVGPECRLEPWDLDGIDLQRVLIICDDAWTGLFDKRDRCDLGPEGSAFDGFP